MHPIHNDFQEFHLSDEEVKIALGRNPYILAYIQNKVAAAAKAFLNSQLTVNPSPDSQLETILELVRLKERQSVLRELLDEWTEIMEVPSEEQNSSQQPSA